VRIFLVSLAICLVGGAAATGVWILWLLLATAAQSPAS
jgi:hypothetical protein